MPYQVTIPLKEPFVDFVLYFFSDRVTVIKIDCASSAISGRKWAVKQLIPFNCSFVTLYFPKLLNTNSSVI